MKRDRREGIVLIITLWVIVVLATVALAYVRQVNLELKMVSFQRDVTVADSLAAAGMRQAIISLREDKIKDMGEQIQETLFRFRNDDLYQYDGGSEEWANNPDLYEDVPFYESDGHQGVYYVEVEDESSKFPINNPSTTVDQIAHLLQLTGVEEDESRSLAGAIIDWRDSDFIPADTGSRGRGRDSSDETLYYNPGRRERDQGLPPVVIKNSDLSSIDEFLLIPGMTPDIVFGTVNPDEKEGRSRSRRHTRKGEYLGLVNYVSVYSPMVNLNTVKEEALEALFYGVLGDQAEQVAQDWTEYRDGSDHETYTRDDRVLKTIDNSDMDSVHFTNVNGFTPELMQQVGGFFAISSDLFVITSLAEYRNIQKGYRAVVQRGYIPFDQLPQYGIDTFHLSDLQQVKMQVKLFEPLFDAKQRIEILR